MNQPAETLSAFIERLREKYSSAAAATKESANESPSRAVLELTLGSAALRDYQLRRSGAISLPQIAVVGPTQVGKSTVVNLLLGRDLALVSSLAGYTKHLQGFAVGSNEPGLRGIERYFGAWEQRGQQDLEPDEVRTYSLTQVPETNTLLADRPYLVWDTPDFDSFSSRRYRASVMEIIGSSDLILVVLSKEKYGDLSVWNMLGLIRGLKKRIIIAVNKLPGDACTLILDSVHQRLTEHGLAEPVIKVVPLPYVAGATLEFVHDESAAVLRSVVGDNLSMDAAADRVSKAAVFIHEHWPDWISPVKVEHQCEAEWRAAVDQTVKEGADFYRQQYLETQQYDTFRRAVIRLLELLEVPALAKPLSQVRRVITWPLRKLWAGVRGGGTAGADREGIESAILAEILRHMQITLRRLVLDRSQSSAPGSHWWRTVGGVIDARWPDLEDRFTTAIHDYRQNFMLEIERAGEELFQRLKQHPTTLNALRVARVTTDAAGVVLVLKTGGIGVNEVVLTPAMLSLTSFLTEGAVGSYTRSVEEALKQKQLACVKRLLTSQFLSPMIQAPAEMDDTSLFQITPAELAHAEQALHELSP